MTATQLLVLALMGGAFAAGWFARGATGGREAAPDPPPLEEGDRALLDAVGAVHAAIAMRGIDGPVADELQADAVRNLRTSLAVLRPLEDRLAASIGADHPCVGELACARQALELACAELEQDGDPELIDAVGRVASDARRRYATGAAAITALPA